MNPSDSNQRARRRILRSLVGLGLIGVTPRPSFAVPSRGRSSRAAQDREAPSGAKAITLFLCGDVMTGRAIDQVLPHPGDPGLHEPYVRDARQYVRLAEAVNGAIRKPVDFAYIWGESLNALARIKPDVRLINLETAITASNTPWPGKGIHYRMHPRNLPVIGAAGIHCCAIANDHVLDWGYRGLAETLSSLHRVGIATAGAGDTLATACAPAILSVPGKGRLVVLALEHGSSGIPRNWAAQPKRAGVCLCVDLSELGAERIGRRLSGLRQAGDLVAVSIPVEST
jgi:poly-gamma-glutamate synthesis protein (capsule biosynthesis protein)